MEFLREGAGDKAKFLLTSRRDEQAWLGELPARVRVPPMPMQERVQLARALGAAGGGEEARGREGLEAALCSRRAIR